MKAKNRLATAIVYTLATILFWLLWGFYTDVATKFEARTELKPVGSYDVYVPVTHKAYTTSSICTKLLVGDRNEIKRLKTTKHKQGKTSEDYIKETTNCDEFIEKRGYITKPLSEAEGQFPLAYSIIMYRYPERAERLLRAIYRPQNYYCVHVDKTAAYNLHNAMSGIASCFDNVFISSRSVNVTWGEYSVLDAEFACIEDLIKYKKWKYFINLTGEEFPLKTNAETVSFLKALNGSNIIVSTGKAQRRRRVNLNMSLSFPAKIWKGSLHIAAQRRFIDFALHNKFAKELREWLKETFIPDEQFFATLQYNPHLGAPGASKNVTDKNMARFKNWARSLIPCHGPRKRKLCIFGYGDLPLLTSRPELFANKFWPTVEPEAYDCLEERHFNRTRAQIIEGAAVLSII